MLHRVARGYIGGFVRFDVIEDGQAGIVLFEPVLSSCGRCKMNMAVRSRTADAVDLAGCGGGGEGGSGGQGVRYGDSFHVSVRIAWAGARGLGPRGQFALFSGGCGGMSIGDPLRRAGRAHRDV